LLHRYTVDIALLCFPVEPVEPVGDLCWGSKKS